MAMRRADHVRTAYRVKRKTPSYLVYDFPVDSRPRGESRSELTVRANAPKRKGWEEDDILPMWTFSARDSNIRTFPTTHRASPR